MEFVVVTEENAADFLAETPNDVHEEETPPEPPEPVKPDPVPEPPPPVPDAPPMPDPIPEIKKPEPPKKPEQKKPEKKKETPKEKPKPTKKPVTIKTGKRVGPVTTGKKNPKKAATERKIFTDAEIAKMLGQGARAGSTNQIPKDEASRCCGNIIRQLEEACSQYGLESSPTGRSPVLTLKFDSNGGIRSVRIKTTSGDSRFDGEVLQAVRNVRRITGLSQTFLKGVQHSVDTTINVH